MGIPNFQYICTYSNFQFSESLEYFLVGGELLSWSTALGKYRTAPSKNIYKLIVNSEISSVVEFQFHQ